LIIENQLIIENRQLANPGLPGKWLLTQ